MARKPNLPPNTPRLRNGACQLYSYEGPEVVISGPAGTGKSIACLLKLHHLCQLNPGIRCLMVRKTRVSLTESALVTFEQHILPPNSPICEGASRAHRSHYTYPNGSVIVIGGLDRPAKIMSTEYDLIFAQEAIELTEESWNALISRNRNGKLKYQQILADTNPDKPSHWLKKRCDSGRTLLIHSWHEDNPALWSDGAWTPRGLDYMGKLENLTGVQKQRLRYGRWVQAEGIVYEEWIPSVHVLPEMSIPADWDRYVAVDFGFQNPFVAQWWAMDHDGRLYCYRQIYQTKLPIDEAAQMIRRYIDQDAAVGIRAPRAIVCDHDAGERAMLTKHGGFPTIAAKKDVQPGIQAVKARLRKAGDGMPRLFVLRDSLVRRDQSLVDRSLPTDLIAEIDGYVWDSRSRGIVGEEPLKTNDHACDAMRYMVAHLDLRQSREAKVWT